MTDNPVHCVRAGIEMTKEQWFSIPQELRQRYWRDTDWGKKPASQEMIAEIKRSFSLNGSSAHGSSPAVLATA